jgi:hypothetical protein
MKQKIEIIVSPSGNIAIDAIGFTGADCEKATAYLEAALGVVGRKAKKPEYHQHSQGHTQQRIGQ